MKTFKSSHKFQLIAVIFLTITAIACSKKNDSNPTPSKGANEVWLQGSVFDPTTLTVAPNTTVTWTNKDSYAHTVTSDSTMFDSGNLNGGGTYSYKFTTKGTFKYHCNYHSMMLGTIKVQ